ncbi:MAG: hypothetical protein ACE5IY_14645 [bacterium]
MIKHRFYTVSDRALQRDWFRGGRRRMARAPPGDESPGSEW